MDNALCDGIPVTAGGNGIALGVLGAWATLRDADRRQDPTDSYDQVAVAVAACVLLLLPVFEDLASPWAGLAGGLSAWRGRRRPRRGGRAGQARLGDVDKFTAIDDDLHAYLVDHGARQDELRRVQAETEAMGDISVMQIAPDQGAFMTLLARAIGAREAIELGTFTGYSAICIARGLPADGRLICCELSEDYTAIARRNFEAAGVADRIEIRLGPALETLRSLAARASSISPSSTPTRPAIPTTTRSAWRGCARVG